MRYNWYRFPWFDDWLEFSGSIPSIYWDTYSSEQRWKFICCRIQKLVEYCNKMGMQLNLQGDAINELAQLMQDFIEHGFDDYYKDQVAQWIDEHLEYVFDHVVKQVYFGLTYDTDDPENSGHFCAYVPDSWSDIEFDTGMQYGQFDYDRLILRFNADGSAVIDNTGRYDGRYVDLERRVAHNEDTLYKPMRLGGTV